MAVLLFNTDLGSAVGQYTEILQHDWVAYSFPFIWSCHSLTLNCCIVTQNTTWLAELRRLFLFGTWHLGAYKTQLHPTNNMEPKSKDSKINVKWNDTQNTGANTDNWKYTVFANYWNTVLLAAILYNRCSTWLVEVWYLCSKTEILVRIGKATSYQRCAKIMADKAGYWTTGTCIFSALRVCSIRCISVYYRDQQMHNICQQYFI